MSVIAAVVGMALGAAAVYALAQLPDLKGVFEPDFTGAIVARAMIFAIAMTFPCALYPALRAARISPLKALRHE